VEVKDLSLANTARLKSLGASGVLTVGQNLQAVFGPASENLKSAMDVALRSANPLLNEPYQGHGEKASPVPARDASGSISDEQAVRETRKWLEAMGGSSNVVSAEACATSRIRLRLKDTASLREEALVADGVLGVMRLKDHSFHLIVGPDAPAYARALELAKTAR
jgi:PTS system glucose-specific IIC component